MTCSLYKQSFLLIGIHMGLLASSVLVCSCSVGSTGDEGITRQEYDLYGMLIETFADSLHNTYAVVRDSTLSLDPRPDLPDTPPSIQYIPRRWARYMKDSWHDLDTAAYRQLFNSLNRLPSRIVGDSICCHYPTARRLVDSLRAFEPPYFERDATGEVIAENYHRYTYFEFSRAAMNAAHTEAVLFMTYTRGSLSGEGLLVRCRLVQGRWVLFGRLMMWVS